MEESFQEKTLEDELDIAFKSDQAERSNGHENIDWEKMRENDTVRLARARELYRDIKEGKVILDGDRLWKLGMLFQHSSDSRDYLIAVELGNLACEAGSESGAWLSAAAEDRYLLNNGSKQKWGTQFTKESGEWEQMPMQTDGESGINDEMRIKKHVPIRDQQMKVFLTTANTHVSKNALNKLGNFAVEERFR